jgi:hypothetical protein
MAIVHFTYGMFIHDARSLTTYIIGDRRDPSFKHAPQGDVQITGSGKRRWGSRRGIVETFSLTLRINSDPVRLWVEDLKGKTVLYRDVRGRLKHCIVTDVDVTDMHSSTLTIMADKALYDIAMSFAVVDESLDPVDGSDA